MFNKRVFTKRHIDIDYEDSDTESTVSWGLPIEQALKQEREFLIRFTREDERKEPFGRVGPEQLGLWLRGIWGGKSRKRCLQVVDVRDDDFARDGHIVGSLHRPNEEFSANSLVKEMKHVNVIVFHCFLSEERAPMCARDYCRVQKRVLPRQEVYLLAGGIYSFIKEAKSDRDLMDFVVFAKRRRSGTRRLSRYSDSDEKLDVPQIDVKRKPGGYFSDEDDLDTDRGNRKYKIEEDRSPRGRDESYRDRDQDESYRDQDREESYRDKDEDEPSYRDKDWDEPSHRGRDRDNESYRDRDRDKSYQDGDKNESYRDRDRDKSYQDRDRGNSYRDQDRDNSYRDRDRDNSYRDRDRDEISSDRERDEIYSDRDRLRDRRTPSPRRSPRGSEQRGRRFVI